MSTLVKAVRVCGFASESHCNDPRLIYSTSFVYFTERNGDGLALTGVKLDLAFAGEPAECGNGFISFQSRDLMNLRDKQAFITVFSKGLLTVHDMASEVVDEESVIVRQFF